MKGKNLSVLDVLIGVMLISIFGTSIFGGYFIPDSNAINVLQNQGYTDIQLIDSRWFALNGCGRGDLKQVDVIAAGTNGKKIGLSVCLGLYGGSSVRQK